MKNRKRLGFTLLETVLTTSVLALVVVAALGSWLLFLHKSNRVNIQSFLDLDVRKVVERFRYEMRNAARETIIFYPAQQEPYQAVGFALASDTDGDGLMDMDEGGTNILWRQTVVYHVWNQAPTQMRRTVFSNRNSLASYTERYNQVASVVTTGNGAGACLSGEQAQTYVLFENLFTGKLWHAEATYDAYAPDANTLDRITFGSLPLEPGAHVVNFTINGKNPASAGRKLRLDQLSAGVAGWPLEAELRTVSGATAAPLFIGQGLAGAAYGLDVATAADGDKVSLTVFNDAIEECNFIGKGRNVALSNTVVRFDETLQPTGFGQGVYVTRLDGQFALAWQGGQQSGDGVRSDYYYPTNCAMRIPILSTWVVKDGHGPVLRFYKSLYNTNLRLESPMVAVVPTPADGSMPPPDVDASQNFPLEFYQDGVKKADWASCTAQKYVDLRPAQSIQISLGSTLMVSFQVRVTTYKTDCFTTFDMKRSGVPGCWVIAGGDASTVRQAQWSTDARLKVVDKLPALELMAVGYADGGDYVSHPFDSRSSAGAVKTVAWDADVPSGAALTVYVRSGNTLSDDGFDISDATAWGYVSPAVNGSAVAGATGRYLQFRALFTSQPFTLFPGESGSTGSGPCRSATPRLRRVLFTWNGEMKYVDITGNLLKGPDSGMIKVDVDGRPLVKGVSMEIEIFKDVATQGGAKERIRSAMMTEVEPRNNNK